MNDPTQGFASAREKLLAGATLNPTERSTVVRGIEQAIQGDNNGMAAVQLDVVGDAKAAARLLAGRLATHDAGRQPNPFQNDSLRAIYDRQVAYDRYVADREVTWKHLTDRLTPGRAEAELEERIRSVKQLANNQLLDDAGIEAKALREFRERTGPGQAWANAEKELKQLSIASRDAKRELAEWEKAHPVQAKLQKPSKEHQALTTGVERTQAAIATAESTIKAGQKEWGKVGERMIAEERGYQQQVADAKRMQQHIAPLREHALKHARKLDQDLQRPVGRDLTRGLNR
jgi:hypothetical protein